MDAQLTHGLVFLSWSTAVMIILTGIFVIKVLFDLSRLTGTMNDTANIVKTELEPTLRNVNETVEIVSSRVKEANNIVTNVEEKVKETARQGKKFLTALGGGVFALSKLAFGGISSYIKSKLK